MIKRARSKRRASAAVEMAVVLPVLLTILFGMIEYGWVFTVRQALVTASREGARTAALPGSTEDEVLTRVSDYMTPLGITSYTVDLTRAEPSSPVETVHVAVPYADVSLVGEYFGSTDYDLGATCSMRKEGID